MEKDRKRKRRSFTPEYKAEAVRLVGQSGKSVGLIARELGLGETVLRRWVQQAEIRCRKRGPFRPVLGRMPQQPDWVAEGAVCSETLSRGKFPANREKNREYGEVLANERVGRPKKPCHHRAFLRNSLRCRTGNFLTETANERGENREFLREKWEFVSDLAFLVDGSAWL
jgi:hypothetical protein